MCDYSLESVQSRPAKVGDQLTTRLFELRPVGLLRRKTRGCSLPTARNRVVLPERG